MRASERMAERARLYTELLTVDDRLMTAFSRTPDYRTSAVARELLDRRAAVCDKLMHVGYLPPDVPADIEEARVV